MTFLQQVSMSGSTAGLRTVVGAGEKMGKTSLVSGAPKTLLVPSEQGFDGVQVPKLPLITSWPMMMQVMGEIISACQQGNFPYAGLSFDSATAMEALIHAHVISLDSASKNNKSATMESTHGGYGKAYGVANQLFRDFLAQCDMLAIHAKLNINITAHVFSAKVKDPTAGEYDSWDLLLHSPKNQRDYGKREILTQWADIVGFLHEPIVVTTTNGVNQGISRGQGRVLAIERTPNYVAGNRYGMRGVIPLPAPPHNAWNALAHALYTATGGTKDVFNREAK